MTQFVSLVFKMSATEVVNVGIELISLALAEECRKILEKRKKRRPRRSVAYPGIFFGEGCPTNSVEHRGQRGRGSGGGSPLVRGSGGSCNLVQEISFHILKFS